VIARVRILPQRLCGATTHERLSGNFRVSMQFRIGESYSSAWQPFHSWAGFHIIGRRCRPNGTLLYVTSNKDFAASMTISQRFQRGRFGSGDTPDQSAYATGSVPTVVQRSRPLPLAEAEDLFVYVANSGNGSGANSVSIFQVCTQINCDLHFPGCDCYNNTLIPVVVRCQWD